MSAARNAASPPVCSRRPSSRGEPAIGYARISPMQAIVDPAKAAELAAAIVRRHLPDPAYRVFLFGSRAAGTARDRSDIDIGIEGPAPVPQAALAAIQDEIEEAPTLYSID